MMKRRTKHTNEAVRISNRPKEEILNSKNEFNHHPIAKVLVERGGKNLKHKYPQQIQSVVRLW